VIVHREEEQSRALIRDFLKTAGTHFASNSRRCLAYLHPNIAYDVF